MKPQQWGFFIPEIFFRKFDFSDILPYLFRKKDMAYKSDYERSRKAEQRFEQHLALNYNLLTENSSDKGYFPFWDISTTSITTGEISKYEVKLNKCYLDTGKDEVVVEDCRIVDQKKHPSGLSLTEADWYCLQFECDTNFYLITVPKLKELVEKQSPHKRLVIDSNGFMLYIFTKEFLLPHCTII